MSRSRIVFFLLSLALVLAIASGTLTRAAAEDDEAEESLYKHLSVFTEVLNLIRRAYVEETSVDGLFAGALDGAADALDAFSTYIPASEEKTFRRVLEIGTGRSGTTVLKERGIVFVAALDPGSPGEQAGLRKGDILAKIDKRSTRGMPLWEIWKELAGEPGTRLELEVIRRGQPQDAELVLTDYGAPGPALEERDGIAILRPGRPAPETLPSLRALVEGLAESGDGRLVVDLRGLAGGSAEIAYRIAALFASGVLGELRGQAGTLESFESEDEPIWSGRMVVLTDRGSLGASEILAAILDQAAGAELVGERTFGYAGRQSAVPLSGGDLLYTTDAFYTGPDGEPIVEGLEPSELVTESSRNLADSEVPLEELILRRGLDKLAAEPPPLREVA